MLPQLTARTDHRLADQLVASARRVAAAVPPAPALHARAPGFELLVVLIRMGLGYRLINEMVALFGHHRLHGLGLGVAAIGAVVVMDAVTLAWTRTITEWSGRSSPVAAARITLLAVAVAAADPSLSMVTAAAAAGGEAAVVRRVRGALVATLAITGAFAVAVALRPEGAERLVAYYVESGLHLPAYTIPTLYVVCAAMVGVGIRRTFDGIDRVRASERRALARKLHDRISNTISGIALLAEASRHAATTNPDRAVRIAEEIREAAGAADREARTIMTDLRLVEAVNVRRAVLGALDRATVARGAFVDADIDPYLELDPALVEDLVAIAEESARNAIRHGRATIVAVSIHCSADLCRLAIDDNGSGRLDTDPDPSRPSGGYGIPGMRERVTERGGTFSIDGVPDEGCRVRARLPIR
ncbi:MAG: histidine kinase [Actinomycetota bacterium]